jgi:hypothetical protein
VQNITRKNLWSTMIIIFLLPLFICACGSGAEPETEDSDDSSDLFSDAAWRLVNNFDVQAGITFESDLGTITIINNSSVSVATPSIVHYDTTTGEESSLTISSSASIAAGDTFTGTFTYPTGAAAENGDFFGILFGEYMGGKFFTSDDFNNLPLFITDGPSDETSADLSSSIKNPGSPIVPKNGVWGFAMTGDTSNLIGTNCPSSSAGFTSSGDSNFSLSCDGNSADLFIDDQYVSFYFSSTSGEGQYESPDYNFPVRDAEDNIVYGTNSFNLTPSTTEAMTGELNWDNSLGCSATYPITMAFETPLSIDVNDICEGVWNISYAGSATCGTDIISISAIPFVPQSASSLSTIDLPTGVPLAINLTTAALPLHLLRQGCTNTYGSLLIPTAMGSYIVPSSGDLYLVDLSLQLFALSESSMMGSGMFHGRNISDPTATECYAPISLTMSAITPCD